MELQKKQCSLCKDWFDFTKYNFPLNGDGVTGNKCRDCKKYSQQINYYKHKNKKQQSRHDVATDWFDTDYAIYC